MADYANQDKQTDESAFPDLYRRWMAEIDMAMKPEAEGGFREAAKRIEKRYLDEQDSATGVDVKKTRRFNILWSNTEILKAALYAQEPKQIIERRYHDSDPVGRTAAQVLDRAIDYHIDQTDYHETVKGAVFDGCLVGRGIARIRYVPEYGPPDPQLGGIAPVVYEEVQPEYVHWSDWLCSPCRRWEQVRWVSYRALMTRRQGIERFGNKFLAVPFTWSGDKEIERDDTEGNQLFKRCQVFEIWDKAEKQVVFIAKGHDEALEVTPDPLGLKGFYPQPRPLTFLGTNSNIRPKAEYDLYRDQAEEMDTLTARMNNLIKAIRVAGVYDATNTELQNFLSQVENTMTPVKNWQAFAEKGGMKGAIDWLPIEAIVASLVQLSEARDKIKQDLYEVTGIGDIIRGASDPTETATAQRIKGQFASLRLQDKQRKVASFNRDLIELMAEVIAEHFSPETLKQMTGLELPDQPIMPPMAAPMGMAAE